MYETPGFIPLVRGGLGNQMFIVAAAFVAAKTHSAPVYLIEQASDCPHNHNKHDYNTRVFRAFSTTPPLKDSDKEKTRYVKFSPGGYKPWSASEIQPGTLMDSYFQYWPALQPFEAELRAKFLEGIYHLIPRWRHPQANAAFLHIRRGDYVSLAHIHFLQPIAYYQRAVLKLLDLSSSQGRTINCIYVLSDDPEWAKAQEFFTQSLFRCMDLPDELDTMALMASCRGGAICSNSTFSWWGAFLGAYGERAPVIIPPYDRWISDQPVPDLFPSDWTVVNAMCQS